MTYILIEQLVSDFQSDKEYRPVVVGIIQDIHGRYLIAKSAKAQDYWNFPQGGVEEGESLDDCFKREMMEEVGVDTVSDLSQIRHSFHFETLDTDQTRTHLRGFSKGKAYFFTFAQYVGDGNLILQKEELSDAKWLDYTEAMEHINRCRPEKARLSIDALDLSRSLYPIVPNIPDKIST